MYSTGFISQLFHFTLHTADSVFGECDVQGDDARGGGFDAGLGRDDEHPGLAQEENGEKDSRRVEIRNESWQGKYNDMVNSTAFIGFGNSLLTSTKRRIQSKGLFSSESECDTDTDKWEQNPMGICIGVVLVSVQCEHHSIPWKPFSFV